MATSRRIKFAIAFDIDGVLTRTPNPIQGADVALSMLQKAGVPFCLMTNGGGGTEAAKAQSVSKLLKLQQPLIESQVCVAHTPMRALVKDIGDKPVLLVGKHYHKVNVYMCGVWVWGMSTCSLYLLFFT